jgi:hypothetical protein
MGFYRVKPDREVRIGTVVYPSGSIVELTSFQLPYHAQNVEIATDLVKESTLTVNFQIPRGSDFFHSIGLGVKTLEIAEFILQNPLVIKPEAGHGLATADKVFIHAFRNTNLNKDVLLNGLYSVTRISSDTFSIPVDGTILPMPEIGYVDYLEDISQSVFTCKLYEPKKTVKKILTEAKAYTVQGSKFVKLEGVNLPSKNIKEGQFLYVDGVLTEGIIQSISLEDGNQQAVLLIDKEASATLEFAQWYAEQIEYDITQQGAFVADLFVSVDTASATVSILLPYSSSYTLPTYIFELFEIKNGVTDLLIKGQLNYG